MRDGFKEVISGWLLVDDFGAVTAHIEAAAKFVDANGGAEAMTESEKKTVELMISRQAVLAEREGMGPFDPPFSIKR
jgi:hypothetical protein